jgi:peptidylprolyl isomerase
MEQWYRDPLQDIRARGYHCIEPETVAGWEDVSCGGKGVFKQLVSEGTGDARPAEGELCSVHLIGYYDDAEFENTRAGKGFPWEFHCGGGQVIAGLEFAVSSMRLGEVARFIIDPIFGYRDRGYEGTVPPNAVVEYEVELLGFKREPTEAEKLEQAIAFKDQGNAFFREGKYDEARAQYKEARQVVGMFPWRTADAALVQRQAALRITILANHLQCVAKQENWREVIKLSAEVFRFDPNHVKTLYRRAQANFKLLNYELAHEDLNRIELLDPTNDDAHRLRRQLRTAEAAVAADQRRLFRPLWAAEATPAPPAPDPTPVPPP